MVAAVVRFRAACDCGWTGTYRSEARAVYSMSRHSCDLQARRAENRARGEARRAAIDRAPKPCLHKQANHQHGTRACYVLDRCRCLPCAKANSDAEMWWTRQKAYGRYDRYVSPDRARAHVLSLMAQGMGLKRIVAVSDLSQGMLWKLLYGKRDKAGVRRPSVRILRTTEARVLAVTLDLADGAVVPSVGATRRLQALVALGWSMSRLAARIGVAPYNMAPLFRGTRNVTVATDRAIRALYDELSMTLAPLVLRCDKIAAARARNYAKAHGWLPPLAWDDDDLDDPTAIPLARIEAQPDELDEAAIYRRIRGDKVRLTVAEKAEVVARMAAAGVPLAEIERRTGINVHRHKEAS